MLQGVQSIGMDVLVPMDVRNQLVPQNEQQGKSQTETFQESHNTKLGFYLVWCTGLRIDQE